MKTTGARGDEDAASDRVQRVWRVLVNYMGVNDGLDMESTLEKESPGRTDILYLPSL